MSISNVKGLTIHKSLSTDVLLHIFSLLIIPSLKSTGCLDFTTRHIPLKLGQVCSSWRSTIWNTPFFWSFISPKFTIESFHVQVRLFEEWIARSKNVPLSMCFLLRGFPTPWNERSPLEIINLITSNSRRLVHLELDVPTSWYEHFVAFRGAGQLPLLQTLVLEKVDRRAVRPIDVFCNAAELQNLHLSMTPLLTREPTAMLPELQWSHLRHFKAVVFSISQFNSLFILSPNLLSCKIIELQDHPGRPVGTLANALNLRKLTIFQCSPGNQELHEALALIYCPSLTSLRISGALAVGTSYQVNDEFALQLILERWKCKLTSLSLGRICLSGTTLIPLLYTIPTLRRLSLIDMVGPTDTMQTLTRELRDSPRFLPALDVWETAIFTPEKHNQNPGKEVSSAIQEFRSEEKFPARNGDNSFKIVTGQIIAFVEWLDDV